jgi:hypothetical protein
MRRLLAIVLASTALAAAPHPDGAMTFQIYGSYGRFVATHTVVPPASAANLSPTQFVARLESARGSHREGKSYWLGPIYRCDRDTQSVHVIYDGKIGKTSTVRVKDLRQDDVILIYVQDR